MKAEEKNRIRESVRAYVAKYPSQNKAAGSLKGTSAGTLSAILNGHDELISDDMWRNLAAQVGNQVADGGWKIVKTGAFQDIQFAMEDAKAWKNVTWVTGEAGSGKTTAARLYTQEHREVFYILCSEDMHKSDFVRELARVVGLRTEGYTIREMWQRILSDLVQMDAPLVVFDEADKLTEAVFHYFISMYNNLEDRCGIVFLSTDYIEKRIENGLRCKKAGYKEIYSRIGRKYFTLDPATPNDVYAICQANGLTDERGIGNVQQDAQTCGFDFRRVKKSIRRELRG